MDQEAERSAHLIRISIRISIRIGLDRSADQEVDLGGGAKQTPRKANVMKHRFMLCEKEEAKAQFAAKNKPMPQIDFRQAFASADLKPLSPSPAQIARSNRADSRVDQNSGRLSVGVSRFDRSSWANIAFVAVTVVGGLFCAFYFFNGGELLRAAAAWPREFLYSRPFGVVGNGKI